MQRIRELKRLLLETIPDATNKIFISSKKMETERAMAETDLTTEEIIIHPERNTVAESVHSFMHEHLHLLMPQESENAVYSMAKSIYHDMTMGEKQKVFRLMAKRAIWED